MTTLTNLTTTPPASRRSRLPMALALTAALGVTVAGGTALVGAGSAAASTSLDSTSSTAEKSAFVDAANQICRVGLRTAGSVALPHHDHDVPSYMSELRAVAADIQHDLRALPRPAADSELLVSRFLDPNADVLARAPQVQQQAAEAGTAKELLAAREQIEALQAKAATATAFGLSYGLTDCASTGH